MIENLNYLYQKQSVAETPNFAGKHKRATSGSKALSKRRSTSKTKTSSSLNGKGLNKDLVVGVVEKENAPEAQAIFQPPVGAVGGLDNGSKFEQHFQNKINPQPNDISFQFPDKDAFTQIENYRYLGDLQDLNAIDTEVNLDFVEKVVLQSLASQNPKFLGDITPDLCQDIRLPDNLELMSLYHEELTNRLLTDPTQNIYRLLMKSNEKLQYVVKTIHQQSTTGSSPNFTFTLPQLLDQAIKLALIDLKIEQKALQGSSGASSNGAPLNGLPTTNIKIVDYQTDELIKSLNDIQQNIEKISVRSRGKSAKKGILKNHMQNYNNFEIKEEDNKEHFHPQQGIPQRQEEPVRNRVLSDSDFKLILKSLRAWKLFTAQNRGQKFERDALARLMINSIDFHEKTLSQKVFRSFLIYKIKRARLQYCSEVIKSIQKKNVEKFYFRTIRKRFTRSRKFKYLKVIAKSYRKEKIFRSSFVGWRKALNKEKIDQITMHQKFTDSGCRATEILLEIFAYSYFQKSKEEFRDHLKKEKIFDIVKLHSFAAKNFTSPDPTLAKPLGTKSKLSGTKLKKRIPGPTRLRSQNFALFNQAIEHVLIQKQRRIFKFWRLKVESLKYLRFKIIMNYKSRAFKGFLKLYKQFKSIKRFQSAKSSNLKSLIFYTLLNLKIKKHLHRELASHIQDSRQKKIRSQFLKEWLGVFNYYSQFTKSHATLTFVKLSSAHFAKKFWRRLKIYTQTRRAHKSNILKADQHYFDRRVHQCFQVWAWFLLVHLKKAKRVGRVLAKNQRWSQKVAYFRALQRAFFLEREAKKVREKALKRKVFLSHVKRQEFKSLKKVLLKICVDKYESGLKTKCLYALFKRTKESLRLNGLLKVHMLKKSKRMMQKAIIAILSSMGEKELKRQEYIQIDRVRNLKVLKYYFGFLSVYTQERKRIKKIHDRVKAQCERRVRKHYMYTLLIRYNKVSLMKQLALEVRTNRMFRMRKFAFIKWLYRYRFLSQVCSNCIQSRERIARTEIFQIWKIKCELIQKFNKGYSKLQRKSELAFLTRIMEELKAYTKIKIHFKKMKQICTFKFLKSHLGKCFSILKYNRYYSIQKRNANRRWLLRQKRAIFNIAKRKWFLNKTSREFLAQRILKYKRRIFGDFKHAWVFQKKLKNTYLKIWSNREQDLLKTCFGVIKNLREIREAVKELAWDPAEKFRARFVLTRWRKFNRARKFNYKHLVYFTQKSRIFTIKRHIKVWRELTYFIHIEKNKAIPHFEEVVTLTNLRKRVLKILRNNVKYRQEKKIKMSKSFEYYRFSLLSKVLETFAWYRDIQFERKSKVEFVRMNRGQRQMQGFISVLRDKVNRIKKYRDIAEFVQRQHDEILFTAFFQKWRKKYAKRKASEPTKNYASSYYATKQKQQVIKILYNHRTFQIIKKNMKITAFNYRSREIQKRVFDRLLYHVHVQREKRNRNEKARIHYKRVLMARWIISLNNSQILNEQILASVNGEADDKIFSNNSGSFQLNKFESLGSLKQLISRTQSKPKIKGQFKSQNHLNVQQLSQIISNQDLLAKNKNNSITDIISQSQDIERDSSLKNSSILERQQTPIQDNNTSICEKLQIKNLEELNSTQDLILAHEILSKKVQSLDLGLGGQFASGDLDNDLPLSQNQAQKERLVSLMSKIKLKYQEKKSLDFEKKLSKSINLSEEDVKMTEKEQRALVVHNKSLAKRVLKNMHERTAGKLMKYEKGIKAQTFMNVLLKKKSFNGMAHYALRKKILRQNEVALVARITQRLKFKVMQEIYLYKEGQQKKVNNLKAATRFVKQMRLKRTFASLKMNLIRAALGKQVALQREHKTVELYFAQWLALANQSLKERHQILSSRNSENGDDLDDIGGFQEGVQSPLMVDEQQLLGSLAQEGDMPQRHLGSSLQRKNQMAFPSSKGSIQRKNQTDFDHLNMLKPSSLGIKRKDQMQFSQGDMPDTDIQINLHPEKSGVKRKNQTDFNNSQKGSKFSTLKRKDQMDFQQRSSNNSRNDVKIGSQEFEVRPEPESFREASATSDAKRQEGTLCQKEEQKIGEDEFKSMSSSKKDEFQSMSSYSN